MEALEVAHAVRDHGIDGCAHGRPGGRRQVLFAASQDLDDAGVDPGLIRENITVLGADVMTWSVGQRIRIGDAEFEITMVCDPCERMDELRPGLQQELEGKRGMLARVLASGELRIGAEVIAGDDP